MKIPKYGCFLSGVQLNEDGDIVIVLSKNHCEFEDRDLQNIVRNLEKNVNHNFDFLYDVWIKKKSLVIQLFSDKIFTQLISERVKKYHGWDNVQFYETGFKINQ